MHIDTTINIKLNILSKIAEVSAAHGISINKIIAILIHKTLNNCSIKAKLFNAVKYQQTGDDIIWHTLHVSFSEDIYEKALDLRKVLKISVSYIIARAIELYIDQVVESLVEAGLKPASTNQTGTDSYCKEYVFISSKCNGLLYFTIFWSKPSPKILKKYTGNRSESCFIRSYM
jgi:hypothetical protein